MEEVASFIARLEEINEADEETVSCVNERRGTDTAQIIVICEDLIRFLWFSLRDGGASLRSRDQAMSKALAEDWQKDMIDAIETGHPEASKIHMTKATIKVIGPPPL
ncbi:hypothetical protein AZE42_06439 [Rhizopogon vesiculosus]|uniref:Uncharacterized protein n=1 Tax=Rhizopogon vesiculosus TaxID=180088 RepID=A0A1J8PQ61_9AGAM|nr:hypothetical protein AZE42_06439 [Rhizopogon vesiculosus]